MLVCSSIAVVCSVACRLVCSDRICAATCSVGAPSTLLQQILQRRVGLVVAVLGVLERDLRAGELARDVGDRSAGWAGRPARAPTRCLSAAYCAWPFGIGARELHRREHREALHRHAKPLLVGAHAVGHRQRLVGARERGRARIVGAVVAGVPGHGIGGGAVDQRGRGVERRAVDALRRIGGVGVEEIVAGRDRGAADQLGAGQRAEARVSAVCRLVAVAVDVAPMVNSFGPGVAEAVAVSVRSRLVPSGSVKVNLTVSPAFGLVAPRSTDIAAGAPAGGGHGRAGDGRGRRRRA